MRLKRVSAPLTAEFAAVKPAAYDGRTIAEQLKWLERSVSFCKKCPSLAAARLNTVFGEGEIEPEGIVLVGEAPGLDEDVNGRPFVGQAGKLLERALQACGLLRQDVYILNCLKCRPDTPGGVGNRPPTRLEMAACLPYLYAQLKILEPAVVVALGGTALEGLGVDAKISEARGKVLRSRPWAIVPTWHPAYVLRSGGEAATQFEADLTKACDILLYGT
jgi:uracil-DNA glycosylase family 4